MLIYIGNKLCSAALLGMLIIFIPVIQTGCLALDKYFVYFPSQELSMTPLSVGLNYEDVYLTTTDGIKLHGWFIPGQSEIVLVWFHGNTGNIGDRLDYLNLMHTNVEANIFIFDYRGY